MVLTSFNIILTLINANSYEKVGVKVGKNILHYVFILIKYNIKQIVDKN
jgi:hypothetical protein